MVRPRITAIKIPAVLGLAALAWSALQFSGPAAELVAEETVQAEVLAINTATFENRRLDTTSSTTTARLRLPDGGEGVIMLRSGSRPRVGDRIAVRLQAFSDGSRRISEPALAW